MADGTNTRTAFRDGPVIVLDYGCYVCEQNGVQKKSSNYCKQCSKCYCYTCVPLHDQMFKTHSLVGRGEMQKWPVAKSTLEILTRRQKHSKQSITLFCDDHNTLCCLKCIPENHKHFNSVRLISEVTEDSQTSNLSNITNDIADMIQQINKLFSDRLANFHKLQNSYENILGELVIMRQKINDAYDKLENNTIAKLDVLRAVLSHSIRVDIYK
ncbi:hypothetical protein DPMN_170134 [Dreissena polymorpha]|uniref:B box-type domain-containing protein n=1 Tax=Dreissena polymorpha TaxID=45954 RepID=A0A9D4DWI2_DREPO|nr:hypothetical protein DPMN_170134 [Dreissena polymorpha]